ncbi:MAG: DUF3316 domain-containing protein, partial [Muribaculaceae bacterium]|nr:DUF3316 domain-containing protein [Muribaculaceae bacterium]
MMTLKNKITAIYIVLSLSLMASAYASKPACGSIYESDSLMSRPVTASYSLEIGKKNVIATYLSPLHYSGTDVTLAGNWSKALPLYPESAIIHYGASVAFSSLRNPAKT